MTHPHTQHSDASLRRRAVAAALLLFAAGLGTPALAKDREDRRDERQEQREERKDNRQDRRENRQDNRQENRVERRDERQDNRADRQDRRQDNRAERRDDRQERRTAPVVVEHRTVINRRPVEHNTVIVNRRPRGVVVEHLPPSPRVVVHGGVRFYYGHGGWYRPSGSRFVVVAPPIGLYVNFLPDFFVTRTIRNTRYYVVDDVYYREERGGYVVTAPPYEAIEDKDNQLFIYPRQGQSLDEQDRDRYECHAWGMEQTGFDPTQPGGGVAPADVADKRSDYQRAMSACLDARGYTVR